MLSLGPTGLRHISFMGRNSIEERPPFGTYRCNEFEGDAPDDFNSRCIDAVYDDINDETTLWAGCLLGELTAGDLCDPAINATRIELSCCYIVVEGDATDGV